MKKKMERTGAEKSPVPVVAQDTIKGEPIFYTPQSLHVTSNQHIMCNR